jgi:Tfp pilus assembly protein PilF
MRNHWAVITLLSLAVLLPVRGQSPDDRYVRIYSLIEEADKQNEAGQSRQAMTKYLEAQIAIKELQQAHPEWNSKLVGYRLEYISSKLEPLTKQVNSGASNAATPANETRATQASPASQVAMLQEEIGRIAAQNAMLEAKLREALSVQPAAIDPRELAKADQRIKALQKERDLLAVSLEQSVSKQGSSSGNKETDAKQNMVTQTAVVSVLRRQNEELQKQITDLATKLKQSGRPTASNEDTLKLKETIAALDASNRVMREEQAAMENRLLQFVRDHGPGAAAQNAELQKQLAEARQAAKAAAEERDGLIQKLNEVTKTLNQRDARFPVVATQELEKQLEAIRAKLQIFEAKQVPFSAEELALFKRPPIKVASAQTNAPTVKKKSNELPPGAGPLVAEALRAIDAGRLAEAEKKYKEVLKQDENNTYVLANLAAVQMDQDKVAEAESTLKKALEADAQDPISLYLMGGLKLRQEKYDEALDALSLSAKLDPEKANTQYYLGKALIQKGSRGPAETALRKAVQLKPGWGDAHYQLAVLYATQEPNFKELALYHYKQAIAGGAARNVELEQWMEKHASK